MSKIHTAPTLVLVVLMCDNCFDREVRRCSENNGNTLACLGGIREGFSEEVTFPVKPEGQVGIKSVKSRGTFTWRETKFGLIEAVLIRRSLLHASKPIS